jgi:hypothetical protein
MASGKDIFIIDQCSLVELKDGKIVPAYINLPLGLICLNSSMDCKIIAYCDAAPFYSIYELVERKFVFKHKFGKYIMGILGYDINLNLCQYVQNVLILRNIVNNLNYFEVIYLKTNNTIITCYGTMPYYCDGVVSIPPPSIQDCKKYNNIILADKSITHECPYFMKQYEQLISPYWFTDIMYSNGFAIVKKNMIYCTMTGILLLNGKINDDIGCYSNYITSSNRLSINIGAPVVEYTYCSEDNDINYIYVLKREKSSTKAAIRLTTDTCH